MLSQAHLFSPNYPSFAPMLGVTFELGGDSSARRHRSKESPPWVCEKCAKKKHSGMG